MAKKIKEDMKSFHRSKTEELFSVKDRVRNLIGDKNWADEGRYKEAILKNIIRHHLPSTFSLASGHVLNLQVKNEENLRVTKQIDIIIYNDDVPVLFREGDFMIATPASVVGIIEVKSTWNRGKFKEELVASINNGGIIDIGKIDWTGISGIFNGLFYYDIGKTPNFRAIRDKIENAISQLQQPEYYQKSCIDTICLGKDHIGLIDYDRIGKKFVCDIRPTPNDAYRIFFRRMMKKVFPGFHAKYGEYF